jgi:hypothetical protein
MTYHVARDNQQLGAFAKEDTIDRYNRGEILPTDLVWTEGMSTWQTASRVFGAPAPAVVTPPSVTPPSPGMPPPIPPPVTGVATPINAASPNLPPKPNNYLVWAILTTLLCCLPLGIVSIIFAAQVDGKYNSGDYEGARNSSAKAKKFSIVAAIVGVVCMVLYIVVVAIAAANGARFR